MAKKQQQRIWTSGNGRYRVSMHNEEDELMIIDDKQTGKFHTLTGAQYVKEMYPPDKEEEES